MDAMTKRDRNWQKETDAVRLNDLAEQHGLSFRRVGMIYRFEDFTAYGLDQALGYAEGFDRAKISPNDIPPDEVIWAICPHIRRWSDPNWNEYASKTCDHCPESETHG